jgi:hypothetical protein
MSGDSVELTLRLRDLNAAVSRGDDDARTAAWSAIKGLFENAEFRARRAERERDELQYKVQCLAEFLVQAEASERRLRAWAERWKRCATEWRRGALEAFRNNSKLRARLDKWAKAERALCGGACPACGAEPWCNIDCDLCIAMSRVEPEES